VTNGPIVIETGQRAEVVVTVNTPASAEPGGYYAGVLFNFSDGTQANQPSEVAIESTVAVPLLLTVKGNYTEAGGIVTFTTADNSNTYSQGPVSFLLRYQNTGDVHLKPVGSITITDMFGKTVKTIKVNEDQGAVLPGTIRKFDVGNWSNVGNAFGQYKAQITLIADKVTSTATITMWVFSTTWLFIIIGVVIVLLIVLMAITRKPFFKKPVAPAQ
jgi:uncharacterized membrane protein